MRHLVGFSLLASLSYGLFGCSLSTVGTMDPVQGGKCDTPMKTALEADGCTQCTCDGATWDCSGNVCQGTGGSSMGTGGNSMGTGGTKPSGSGGTDAGGSSMGGTGMGGSAGQQGTCKPGDSKLADDGCNTCNCTMDGQWACSLTICNVPACTPMEEMTLGCKQCICDANGSWSCTLLMDAGCSAQTCTPGETMPSADGCNTCTCGTDGQFACTEKACANDCPPPLRVDPKTCMSTGAMYAQDPSTGQCCAYSSSCETPVGWKTYSTPDCSAGTTCAFGTADCDGDPTNGCETKVLSDPSNCGSCGTACLAADGTMTECGMGTCLGQAPPPGKGCLYEGVEHQAGDSFPARDGCNACSCVILGDGTTDIACTDRACACNPDTEPYRSYAGKSPDACKAIDFMCPDNTTMFTNACGCGCEQSDQCPDFFDCMPGGVPMTADCDPTLEAMCPYSTVAM